ncbi:MAG: hypothetical protein ACPGSM_09650 [Thiolinea sp.]
MAISIVRRQVEIGLNQEALDEWIAYRAEDLKKPMTPRAIKMVERKLMQWPESEQMRMVEAAIENNWMGIHYVEPPKVPRGASTRDQSIEHELTDTSWAH